ncbi:MAG: A/G-specific adenine glycosylase [Hellea sp.]|nr:A/G-specific adenine glycosylase [Hellea sp.]
MPYAKDKVKIVVVKLQSHVPNLRARLLDWYDQQGRILPWRIRPEDRARGMSADPYAIWLSEIMLQQTTVSHATPYWKKFLARWPSVIDLANANRDQVLTEWAGLGYYARARNLHKCAEVVRDRFGGQFPETERQLLDLPGIGPYTAATMAAICFGEPTNIVDGNVERVISRLYGEAAPLPKSKLLLRKLAAPLADPDRPGDYGQALMDLGATICTPRAPQCSACPWNLACRALRDGEPEKYPQKIRKVKPVKFGAVFALIYDDHILLRQRPDKGLLGGMLELPTTTWNEAMTDRPFEYAPTDKNWEKCSGQIKHIFTHFELRLDVYRAASKAQTLDGIWAKTKNLSNYPIPTLTKKAIKLALDEVNRRET